MQQAWRIAVLLVIAGVGLGVAKYAQDLAQDTLDDVLHPA